MYQLEDVLDANGVSRRDMFHIIGKDFIPQNIAIGERAILDNITDSHIYRRVEKTTIIDRVVDTFKELKLFTKDSTYILKKI